MKKVFIDGKEGTTGLRIYDRLAKRNDITLITLPEEQRKDINVRKKALNSCDIAFLCLPDAAAIEAVGLVENPDVIIIDTSTAHRTQEGWAYGFPELDEEKYKSIKTSKRIAVPGCHAGGFIALVYPLIKRGILKPDIKLVCNSITGYSGGGKKMIAEYEDKNRSVLLDSPRQYALTQNHKHLKEMTKISGLNNCPIFSPIVSDFYSGMVMTVAVFASDVQNGASAGDIINIYKEHYCGPVVSYKEDDEAFLAGNAFAGKDSMSVFVKGNEERILLIAAYDNLGKGASGAAVECMNISMGASPIEGLEL